MAMGYLQLVKSKVQGLRTDMAILTLISMQGSLLTACSYMVNLWLCNQ